VNSAPFGLVIATETAAPGRGVIPSDSVTFSTRLVTLPFLFSCDRKEVSLTTIIVTLTSANEKSTVVSLFSLTVTVLV